MKIENLKPQIIYGAVSGFVYATVLALIDYFNDQTFDFWKFVIGFSIFGLFMSFIMRLKKIKSK